ncbi:MAG: c-type cytochrome domain-containing protein [Bacteroidota bacterium]|nr:c-type cytochrome domain-containing protein [Bacteroidota bacterium]
MFENIGHLHPLIVHLPIGILILVSLFEIIAINPNWKSIASQNFWLLLFGSITAILSCFVGFALENEGGYDHDLVEKHELFGIITAIISVIALSLNWAKNKFLSRKISFAYQVMAFSFLPLLSITGHYGGSLTHGEDYLNEILSFENESQTASEFIERKEIQNLDDAVLYSDVIYPILNQKCESCHGPSKSKGGFMLHTYDALLKGGKSGNQIVAGAAFQSGFYQRMMLPVDNKMHMPPKGSDPLDKNELSLIEWWINHEASNNKKVSELNVSEEDKLYLRKILDLNEQPTGPFALEIAPANESKIAELEQLGFTIRKISQKTNLLSVTASRNIKINDEAVAKLNTIANNIASLDLSKTGISNKCANAIANLPNLTKIFLQQTNISDELIVQLTKLNYLEYINLNQTKVSENGIKKLIISPSLKTVVIWKTNISPNSVNTLGAQRSDLKIIN